jgi:putative endonuclease
MRAKDALGKYGEDEAARFLTGEGLQILERNWRCREGEIDLVVVDGDVLVVCEVKTRRDDRFGGPLVAVTPEKVARLRRLAAEYARGQRWRGPLRVDVVAVWAPFQGPVRIEHVRGAA